MLTDLSVMPFGIYHHKRILMQDVPASYFHWLWTSKGFRDNKQSDVAAYIRRNLNALKQENTDLIWEE